MDWVTIVGWIGPLVGGGVGLLGAAAGTYFTLKNTAGPRERRFAVRASLLCWAFALLFVAGMAVIPDWYKLLLVIPYAGFVIFGVRKWNEIQFRIRNEEAAPPGRDGG